MKYQIVSVALLLFLACSGTRHLEMAPDADLSTISSRAQCWLLDFEEVCISLSENEGFSDTRQLEDDIKRVATMLKDLSDEQSDSWYNALTEKQSDRLHELILAIVVHYGVKHFIDV